MPPTVQSLSQASQQLRQDRISLLHTVLDCAVMREAITDVNLRNNKEEQNRLHNIIVGLQVVWVFSFLQHHVGEEIWNAIKDLGKREKARDLPDVPDVDVFWGEFDILKYARDCFGHSPTGEMFPHQDVNSQRFLTLIAEPQHRHFAKVNGSHIEWSKGLPQSSFQVATQLLDHTIAFLAAGRSVT